MLSSVLAPASLTTPFINRLSTFQVRRGVSGVLGNGASNPLSASFATLAAAQTIFPHATALTNELDWAVAQGQINAAQAAGGGVIELGEGQYVTTGTTLTLPGAGEGVYGAVSMAGAGFDTTRLVWLADGAAGDYYVTCANRDSGSSAGFLRDLGFKGPGTNVGFGNMPCNVSGLAWGARRECSNLFFSDLRYGLSIKGDHTTFRNVRARSCGYGMYFDNPNPYLYGNLRFESYESDACWVASVGVHKAASIASTVFLGGSSSHDSTPFGYYKEIGTGGLSTLFVDSRLIETQMENIGNAAISGGNPINVATDTQGTERPDIYGTRFQQCQMTYASNSNYRIAGLARDAIMDLRYATDLVIDGIIASQIWTPGDVALILGQGIGSMEIRGDVDRLLSNCSSASKTIYSTDRGGQYGPNKDINIALHQTGLWSGKLLQANNTSIGAGDCVAGLIAVSPSTGSASEIAVGVARNAASGYAAVAVATSGRVGATFDANIRNEVAVYSGPSAKLTATSGGKALGIAVDVATSSPFSGSMIFYGPA